MSSQQMLQKSLSTIIQIFCHVTMSLFCGSECSHGIQLWTASSPHYDAFSDNIVTMLTCNDDTCSRNNSTLDWLAIDGTRVLNVTDKFKLPGRISSTKIATTTCTSNLTLRINSDKQYATLPQFQCQIKNNVGHILAISSRKHPRILINIQPATINVTAFRGTNVTIFCPFGNNLPLLVTKNMRALWWRKSVTLPSSNVMLFLTNVTDADEGRIECQPTGNELYQAGEKSSWVYLTVKGPPPKPMYFQLGPNVTCNERVSLIWEWPNNTFTMNITVEVNCSFLDNIISFPFDSEAREVVLHKSFTYGSCRIQFRNPAGTSGYSDSVLVCRSVEPSKLLLLTLAGVGIVIIVMISYLTYKRNTWSILKKHLAERCRTALTPVESKSTTQAQDEKIDKLLAVCTTTNQMVQEIGDQRSTTSNNEVNRMESGASMSVDEPPSDDDEALSEVAISQEVVRENDGRSEIYVPLEVRERLGGESEV